MESVFASIHGVPLRVECDKHAQSTLLKNAVGLGSLPQELLDELPRYLEFRKDLKALALAHPCFRIATRKQMFHTVDCVLQSLKRSAATESLLHCLEDTNIGLLVKRLHLHCHWEDGAMVNMKLLRLFSGPGISLFELEITIHINTHDFNFPNFRHDLEGFFDVMKPPKRVILHTNTVRPARIPTDDSLAFRNFDSVNALLRHPRVENLCVTADFDGCEFIQRIYDHNLLWFAPLGQVILDPAENIASSIKNLDIRDIPIRSAELRQLCIVSTRLQALAVLVASEVPNEGLSPLTVSDALQPLANTLQTLELAESDTSTKYDGTRIDLKSFKKLRRLNVYSTFYLGLNTSDRKGSLRRAFSNELEELKIHFRHPQSIFLHEVDKSRLQDVPDSSQVSEPSTPLDWIQEMLEHHVMLGPSRLKKVILFENTRIRQMPRGLRDQWKKRSKGKAPIWLLSPNQQAIDQGLHNIVKSGNVELSIHTRGKKARLFNCEKNRYMSAEEAKNSGLGDIELSCDAQEGEEWF